MGTTIPTRCLPHLDETAQDRVVNAENRVVPIDDEHVVVHDWLLHGHALADPEGAHRGRDRRRDRERS